jgi:hypothetical protein
VTHAIGIDHPLKLASNTEANESLTDIVKYFFNQFWWMRIESFYGMRPVFKPPPDERHLSPDKLIVFWQVHSMTQVMGFKCEAEDDANLIPIDEDIDREKCYPLVFADVFQQCLEKPPKKQAEDISIRGIRSMVTQLFSKAASAVAQGQVPWAENGTFRKDAQDAFEQICEIASLNKKTAGWWRKWFRADKLN